MLFLCYFCRRSADGCSDCLFHTTGMGIKGKFRMGFIAIGIVLLLTVVTSYLELTRLNRSTQQVIDSGAENVMISKAILDLLQAQNNTAVTLVKDNDLTLFAAQTGRHLVLLDSLIDIIRQSDNDSELVESVKEQYATVIDTANIRTYRSNERWYFDSYNQAESHLMQATKEFMIASQRYVVDQTTKLKVYIYRSTMQGIVALATCVVIMIVFYILMSVYFINPVIRVTRALDLYAKSNMLFDVKIDGQNEVYRLKEHLARLIAELKAKKTN